MRRIARVVVFFLLVGCAGRDKVPSGVIPREEMGKILWDMIEADQFATYYLIKDSAHRDEKMETLKLYQTIFQLHKVSREKFLDSYKFYLTRPDLSRTMFDSLLSQGNRLRMESYRAPQPVTPPAAVPAPVPAAGQGLLQGGKPGAPGSGPGGAGMGKGAFRPGPGGRMQRGPGGRLQQQGPGGRVVPDRKVPLNRKSSQL